MYRIALGGINHESNTFCPPTTLEMFRQQTWCVGPEIVVRFSGTRTYIGGMIEAAGRLGVDLAPTFAASAQPWGAITPEAFTTMVDELTGGLRQAMPVDAVCLALHGAGVAEGISDLESAVLEAVRGVVGPAMPIAVTLDLHGNITPRMVELATGLFGVHEYPHIDSYERGQEAMEFLVRVLRGEITPEMAVEILPLLIPASPSRVEPARAINEYCHRWEREPGMIDCAFFHGFSHTDIPEAGVTVVAVAESDLPQAQRAARAVAQEIWARRAAFQKTYPAPAEAVAEAIRLEADGGPVLINEISDNPGGGAPGDGTHLLRAMLDAGLTDSAFGTLYDPEVAEAAHQAGVGASIRVRLGAKTDALHGEPIDLEAYVKCLTDGKYRVSALMGRGWQVDLRKTARLASRGVDIVVASRRAQVLDPEPFLLHGIDVARCRIVGLKSSAHFRAGFERIARHIVSTDSPGLSTSNLPSLPYRRLRRPIYPLDRDAVYGP
ncbi:MAG: M81 family metallopeptidase [bacterium]|nr:M81 family metallopeptidase [bacterium]